MQGKWHYIGPPPVGYTYPAVVLDQCVSVEKLGTSLADRGFYVARALGVASIPDQEIVKEAARLHALILTRDKKLARASDAIMVGSGVRLSGGDYTVLIGDVEFVFGMASEPATSETNGYRSRLISLRRKFAPEIEELYFTPRLAGAGL